MFRRAKINIPNFKNAPVHSGSVFRWLAYFIAPYWRLFTFLTANRLTRMIYFAGIQPLLVAKIIQSFETGQAFEEPAAVWNLAYLFGVLGVFFSVIFFLCLAEANLRERVSRSSRLLGLQHLNRLSAQWHEHADSGGKLQKIMTGSHGLFEMLRIYFHRVLIFSAIFIGMIIAFIGMQLPLLYIGLFTGWMIVFMGVSWWVAARLMQGYNKQNHLLEKLIGKVYEFVNATLTVKTFNLGPKILEQAKEGEQANHEQAMHVHIFDHWLWGTRNVISISFIILIFYFAISGALNGALSIAAMALIMYQALQFWEVLESFSEVYTEYLRNSSAFRRLIELLRQPVNIDDAADSQPLVVHNASIEFKDINFAYNAENPVFKGLDVHVKAGERVGIVGRSGSGKSTLVKLLLRFYDPEHGTIEIDGQNICSVNQDSLRGHIAVIPQDVSLFNHSVMDNIRYGRLEASDDAVMAAARTASADAFIDALPQKYETLVGERGLRLSGGQRQRIGIARAILKDAPILVLDEATSALDSESEAAIQAALEGIMEGKTVIAIAHRLSTLRQMDRIIVMDAGRIIEDGTHDELVAKPDGHYAKLWGMQSGGFLRG